MAREIIFTENAPKAVGPYVQAVRSNGMVYVSGAAFELTLPQAGWPTEQRLRRTAP